MKFVYAIVIGFAAASMITMVDRFEPNRALARLLMTILYLTGAFAIFAKLM